MSRCEFGDTMCSKLRLVGVCQKAELSTLAERQIPLIVEENFIVSFPLFFIEKNSILFRWKCNLTNHSSRQSIEIQIKTRCFMKIFSNLFENWPKTNVDAFWPFQSFKSKIFFFVKFRVSAVERGLFLFFFSFSFVFVFFSLKSLDNLLKILVEHRHLAFEPFLINDEGSITLNSTYLSDPLAIFKLFYIDGWEKRDVFFLFSV